MMLESLRLFFALWPDDEVRAALARAMPVVGPGGRVIPVENLHATLAFIGSTDIARLEALMALAAEIRGGSFVLSLDRYEIWERALVALVAQQLPTELQRLAEQLRERLASAGFPTDARPYRAHVTLIRERRRGSRREGLVTEGATAHPVSIPWRVDEFALVRSHTGARGSRYEVLQRWPLRP